ncbi:hypothetical protein BDW62DRAFT_129573 [Aspergillus aurantiobrunneus]
MCVVNLVLSLLLETAVCASQPEIITRDVCILGGGATGTYAAIQLIERGYTVAIVEEKSRLGGHSDTLYFPNGEYIDYGIRAYFNDKSVKDFFAQLDVDYQLYSPGALQTEYVNLQTGERVSNSGGVLDMIVAVIRYRAALEPFDYLSSGGFYLPEEVPEVLLRPFREFVEEHSLEGALQLIYTFSDALGDILATPLLYVIQLFGTSHINALLQGPYIIPNNGSAALYSKAATYIGEGNVLYESTVTQATRNATGVELLAGTPEGRKIIQAKKLLVTFPPLLSKLQGFDLDENEQSLFSKWVYTTYYAAIVNNSGIPDGLNVFNTNPNNQPGSLPVAPFECILDYSGVSGFYRTRIVGGENFTQEDAQQLVLEDLGRMRDAGTFPITQQPEIIALESHSPSSIMVPVDDVRDGFYRKLYALQGQRSTYYTGYSFCTDYSAQLWNYTLSVVNMMTHID